MLEVLTVNVDCHVSDCPFLLEDSTCSYYLVQAAVKTSPNQNKHPS
jgi:hypothetical protein